MSTCTLQKPCPVCVAFINGDSKAEIGRKLGIPRSTVFDHLKAVGRLGEADITAGSTPSNPPPALTGALKAQLLATLKELGISGPGVEAVASRPSAVPQARVIRPEADNLVDDPATEGTAVWLGCLHLPWCHDAALDAALAYVRSLKPSLLIVGGDGMDMHSISRHEKDSFLRLQDEVEQAQPRLRELEALPAERRVWLMGNHCERVERLGKENPQLDGLASLDFANVCRLDNEWAVYADQTHYRLGGERGLLTLHGNVKAAGRDAISGQNVAHKMRLRLKHSVLFAHFHRDETAPQMTGYHGDPIWEGHAIGWMGDARKAAGYITKPEWTVSFATIHWDRTGFEVQHHIWKQGRFSIGGRRYAA